MNKYRRWYNALISRACNRDLDGYCERHHIKPKSCGGSDNKSNIVKLTYREHFLAHWLLTKFLRGEQRRKMRFALARMGRQGAVVAGWQYALISRAKRDALLGSKWGHESPLKGLKRPNHSKAMKGNKFAKGHAHTFSADHRKKLSLARKGKRFPKEWCENISKGKTGTKQTPEHIAKRIKNQIGRQLTPEHLAKLSAWQIGTKRSKEWCKAISAGKRAAFANRQTQEQNNG